jgi:hypothetical protein
LTRSLVVADKTVELCRSWATVAQVVHNNMQLAHRQAYYGIDRQHGQHERDNVCHGVEPPRRCRAITPRPVGRVQILTCDSHRWSLLTPIAKQTPTARKHHSWLRVVERRRSETYNEEHED